MFFAHGGLSHSPAHSGPGSACPPNRGRPPWPRHRASVESVLVVTEGRCIFKFPDADHGVSAGDSLVIPADVWHKIVADPAFTAVHIMPKEIRFTFSQ
ncbi:cupin domain-containing protein [Corynebacterium flavescens]|uniref:cupin domain-containing protein n=1 Tax=Corynebacterium flavescens TaxID=28028 RepID=UPI0028965B06|nr:cupin domain-containing protein [Corynebacterium flavescens]